MEKLAAACVVEHEGKLLVVSRGSNLKDLNLPAGKVEESESLKAAAMRELLEETGIVAEELNAVMSATSDNGYLCVTFVVTKFSGALKSSEEGKASWKNWSDILTTNSSFYEYNRVLYSFLKQGNNVFSDS